MRTARQANGAGAMPRWLAGVLTAALLAGCAPLGTGPADTATAPPSWSASSPAVDLTAPGAARAAVQQLVAATGGDPVIRVTVTASDATLTYVSASQAVTLDWDGGHIAPLDSDITYVDQQPFNPADFDLDDVGALFATASAVAGASTAQELQINEYNQGKVLMTVTTSPESQTIFFRPDGTMIDALNFTTSAGIAEALRDTTGDGVQVVQIGIDATALWADVRINQTEEEHRVRPPKLPAYTVTRTTSTKNAAFSPTQLDPSVVATLLTTLPGKIGDPDSAITMVMDTRDGLGYPTMRFTVGLTTLVYRPDGTDITKQVG